MDELEEIQLTMEFRLQRRIKTVIVSAVIMSALAHGGDNYSSLQGDINGVLKSDARNAGVIVAVRYQPKGAVLVYDLTSVANTNSMADVFRVFLQFAQAEKSRKFNSVELDFRRKPRFVISGKYFQQLGEESGVQNPVYTMRTFPENLLDPDGSRAFPVWAGGLLGVTNKQMEDFNEFHRKWWLNDFVATARVRMGSQPRLIGTLPAASAAIAVQPRQQVLQATAAKSAARSINTGQLPANQSTLPLQLPEWASSPLRTPEPPASVASAASVEINYVTPVLPAIVISDYEEQLRKASVAFATVFDGIGTSIRASQGRISCVLRISEQNGGTRVETSCAQVSGSPAQLPAAAPIMAQSPEPLAIAPSSLGISPGGRTKPESLEDYEPFQVQYTIDGSARTVLMTCRADSGRTEQRKVSLPYTAAFWANRGAFLYLSAQNQEREGTVHVAIRISGVLYYQGAANSPFGIATASGSITKNIPRIIQ